MYFVGVWPLDGIFSISWGNETITSNLNCFSNAGQLSYLICFTNDIVLLYIVKMNKEGAMISQVFSHYKSYFLAQITFKLLAKLLKWFP